MDETLDGGNSLIAALAADPLTPAKGTTGEIPFDSSKPVKVLIMLRSLGEHTKEASVSPQKDVLDAHLAVDGESGKYPEFMGNLATVYPHPMARGGRGNGHYKMDSRVYIYVGLAMGEAMVKLLNVGKN